MDGKKDWWLNRFFCIFGCLRHSFNNSHHLFWDFLNSYIWPDDATWCPEASSALVQFIICRVFVPRSLQEPMLSWIGIWGKFAMKFESKCSTSNPTKWIWKCHLQNLKYCEVSMYKKSYKCPFSFTSRITWIGWNRNIYELMVTSGIISWETIAERFRYTQNVNVCV